MALWGQVLKANTKTKVQVPDEASLIVNQAVLPKECSGVISIWISGMMDDEGAQSEPICIAHLDWARFPQVSFEALIPNGDEVEFEVRGASDVHLLGFFSPIEMEDSDMDSDEHGWMFDSDEEDGEEGEESDEGHSGPKIEELSSSEEEQTPAPKKAAPAPVSQPPAKKQKTGENTSKATADAPKPSQPKQQAQPAQQQSPKQDGDKKKRKRNKKNKGGNSQ